jgi:hypothetical protein
MRSFRSNVNLRCMEHSLHLAAKHFVQTIAPHSGKKRGTSGTDTGGDPASDDEDHDGDDEDDDQDEDFITGDSLGKAIALVKQVSFLWPYLHVFCINTRAQICKSPQAWAFFRATCSQVGIAPLELLLWIRTRWGSLFKFLERFIQLKAVRFILPSYLLSFPLTS